MTPEDEAFDEIARKQGHSGGGYQAKRRMAADKLQEPEREALKLAVDGLEKILHTFAKDGKVVMSSMIRNELFAEVNSLLQQTKTSLAQPAQEPVARVSGTYGGRFTYEPINPAMVLPIGMALYSSPQENT